MTRVLSALLGAQEPLFSMGIADLERATGQNGIDIRLTADIIGAVHQKSRELGLDPRDTTGEELYQSLYHLVRLHDAFLAKRIGCDDPADVFQVLPRIKQAIDEMELPRSVWVLKHAAAKRLLKATPPKNIMKQLGYRSVDSMLKRESTDELFAALRFGESNAWMSQFLGKYAKLQPSDFEMRNVEVKLLDPKKWQKITGDLVRKNRHNITHVKELGVVLILPLPLERLDGVTITVLPLVLHYINEIRMYSSYFKLQQVRSDFGEILSRTLSADPAHHAVMAGHKIHWRVIHRRYSTLKLAYHPEVFEPHLMPEDFTYLPVESVLYRLEPALHFWKDLEYVGMIRDGITTSFNLMDMALNYVNRLPYGYQFSHHFREALKHELHVRYLGQGALEAQVLRQLDNNDEPELLVLSGRKPT